MELQLTPEAEKRILDIATEAIARLEAEVNVWMADYPPNLIIGEHLARVAIANRLRTEVGRSENWSKANRW